MSETDIAVDVKDGIPADIRNTVRRLLEYGDWDRMFQAVARAILAERDRCAKVADNHVGFPSTTLEGMLIAKSIAAAIRSGE